MTSKPSTKVVTIQPATPHAEDTGSDLTAIVRSARGLSEQTDRFLYALSQSEHIGRKSSHGVTVDLGTDEEGQSLGTVTFLTMADVYDYVGLDKGTGSRRLRAHVLRLRFPSVKVVASQCASAPVSALFERQIPGVLVKGVTATKAKAAFAAAAAKPAAKPAGKGEGKGEGEGEGTDATPRQAEPLTLPNSLSARLTIVEAILASVKPSDLTPATVERLSDLSTILDGILSTPASEAASA